MKLDISADKILLRPLKLSDLDELYEVIMKNPDMPYHMSWELPKEKKETEENLTKAIEDQESGKIVRWGIFYKDELVGMVSLDEITRMQRKWKIDNASLGYWIVKNYEGIGFATKAAHAAMKFGFTNLNLHKITVGHISDNVASQKVIEKLGFRYVGEQIDHCFHDGKWWDHKMYEMLEQDFK